jgi:hypothetical protein
MVMAENKEREITQAEWNAYLNGAVENIAKFIVRRAKPGDSLADVMQRERTLTQESED